MSAASTELPVANQEFLCARCAWHTKTCCQNSDIYTTPKDVERIADFTGQRDFTEYRTPVHPVYLDHDDDPAWRDNVFREDHTRRVLKQQPNGDCTFLGEHGCVMPLEVRPLICRLYPFDYTEQGILEEFARGCPLELLTPGKGLLEELDLHIDDARHWHAQLYAEIRLEPHAKSMQMSDAGQAAVVELTASYCNS